MNCTDKQSVRFQLRFIFSYYSSILYVYLNHGNFTKSTVVRNKQIFHFLYTCLTLFIWNLNVYNTNKLHISFHLLHKFSFRKIWRVLYVTVQLYAYFPLKCNEIFNSCNFLRHLFHNFLNYYRFGLPLLSPLLFYSALHVSLFV